MVKALVLLSGGLDSMLAAKVLWSQGIEVVGICFASNFYGCKKAQKAAAEIGIELKVIDISEQVLGLVKNPPSGHGKNLNPCVDCHALMIKTASKIAQEQGFDFVATGEVLGQRPFSQNKAALDRVEKIAGISVLRPLSAKLLSETEMEKSGLVDREKLLDINGRNRDRQMELAKKFGFKYYETPGGGCLLTDIDFSKRLAEMISNWPDCNQSDVDLLKYGRIFWTKHNEEKVLIVVGRHQEDNEKLEKAAQKGDILIQLEEIPGPIVLIRFKNFKFNDIINNYRLNILEKVGIEYLEMDKDKNFEEILKTAGFLAGLHANRAKGREVDIKFDYK